MAILGWASRLLALAVALALTVAAGREWRAGAAIAAESDELRKLGKWATAEVQEVSRGTSGRRGAPGSVTYVFTTAQGERRQGRGDIFRSAAEQLNIGDKVEIRYHPENPRRCQSDPEEAYGKRQYWVFGGATAFGVLVTLTLISHLGSWMRRTKSEATLS